MASRLCPHRGCVEIVEGGGPCDEHRAAREQARGTASQRGYTSAGHQTFRRHVLTKNHGICALCHLAPATVADHWPHSRRELQAQGLNPDDPQHGRPLCKPCHDRETATNQPGGWNA